MSYEPLHHKYRPQTFGELVGQEAIATTLSNALQQRRIAPAYLFTGARGTGKTSSARIFAKSLNCLSVKEPTANPCGTCEVCRMIARGSALDVIEIDAASNTGVDNIRELIERSQFAPVQCRFKVYVIDEVHMLSNAAFNALLKTLEEPPPHVVFVLATTDPQRVLPTIISRCQRFDFRRIPLDAMVQHLRAIAQQETIPITDEAVQLVSQISQGGLRDAESLLDQLSLLDGEIGTEQVWDLVGAVPERDLMAMLGAIAQDDPETLLDHVRNLMDRGREPTIVLQNLAGFYRDLLIAKTAPARNDLVAITEQTWGEMVSFVEKLPISLLQHGQQHLRESEPQIRNSAQPRLWLEVTLMGLLPSALTSAPAPITQPIAPIAAPTWQPPTPAPAPAPAPTPTPPPAAQPPSQPTHSPTPPLPHSPTPPPTHSPTHSPPPPPTTAPNLEQTWQQALSLVQPNSTQILLRQQCFLLGYDGSEARIGVKARPLLNMAKSKLSNIEAAFKQFAGHPIRVSLEVAEPRASNATSEATSGATSGAASGHVAPPPSTGEQRTSYQPDPGQGASGQGASGQGAIASPPTPTPAPAPTPAPTPATHSPQNPAPPASPAPSAAPTAQAPSAPPQVTPPPAPEPPIPTPIRQDWEEDPVVRAAKTFASFFNGQVIDFEAESGVPDALPNPSDLPPDDLGSEGDDVPF